MTVETKLALSASEVRSFSESNNEPKWFTDLRAAALEKAVDLPMPKPDKTNIEKWDFINFPKHTVKSELIAGRSKGINRC